MYQFVCPRCGGQSFSASKLSTLSNPECPYCGSTLYRENEQVPDTKKTTGGAIGEKSTSENEQA